MVPYSHFMFYLGTIGNNTFFFLFFFPHWKLPSSFETNDTNIWNSLAVYLSVSHCSAWKKDIWEDIKEVDLVQIGEYSWGRPWIIFSDLEDDYRQDALFFWSAKQKEKNQGTQSSGTRILTANRENRSSQEQWLQKQVDQEDYEISIHRDCHCPQGQDLLQTNLSAMGWTRWLLDILTKTIYYVLRIFFYLSLAAPLHQSTELMNS